MDGATEARLLQLLEIEEIKQIKYRYMRYLMLGEIEAMAELFAEDVKAEYSDGKYCFEGRESLLEFLRGTHAPDSGNRSIWSMGHPEIEITGEHSAVGIWFFTHLTVNQKAATNLQLASFYRDEYVKRDGRWRFQYTGYKSVLHETWSRNDTPSIVLEVG